MDLKLGRLHAATAIDTTDKPVRFWKHRRWDDPPRQD
jgi:hypothetical protein